MVGRRKQIGTSVHVDVDGFSGDVHVREDGRPDGIPLVLIHGFGGSMHWLDLAVPLLEDAFRLIRIDLLGHGSTGGPAADAPLQSRVVAAVLDDLDIAHATAIGHSFGADVAVDLAETSDRIERLIIVAQAPDYSDANLPRGNRLMTLPVLGALLHTAAKPLVAVVTPIAGMASRHPHSRVLAAQARADFFALNPAMFRVVILDRGTRMAARPLDAQLMAAGKPTLVVLGERDHFYGARAATRYRSAGASVEVLAASGHSPFIDVPAEAVGLIRSWLLPLPAGSAPSD